MQVLGKIWLSLTACFRRLFNRSFALRLPKALPPVEVPDLLPDIEGGEKGLLPVKATRRPLPFTVPKWPISDPSEDQPERLVVRWDGQLLEEKSWTTPVPKEDLEFEVAVDRLGEGRHTLEYEVTLGNEGSARSIPVSLFIDKTAPVLGGQRGRLEIVEDAEEVERDGLTARYLERHGNRLRTLVPAYLDPMPGDILSWYWGEKADDSEYIDCRKLTSDDHLLPIYIDFQLDTILQAGDGLRYAYYEIEDRAGNLSNLARALELDVKAQPIPRQFDWVEIAQASGSGAELSLSLNEISEPLLVEVPETAQMFPDEQATVIWGQPGEYGYFETADVYPGTERCFAIPMKQVLAYGNQTVVVRYQVSDGVEVFPPSDPRNLKVAPLSEKLPQIVLVGATSNGFSLGSAPAKVPVKLDPWRFIAVGQRINIWVTGVLQNGADSEPHHVLQAHAITQAQERQGIGANNEVTVLKTFLATLKRDLQFTLHVQVSFDNGANWVDFPQYHPTLRA